MIMKKLFAIAVTLTFLLCGMTVNAQEAETDDGLHASIQPVTDSPEWVTDLPEAQDASQLFIVGGLGMDKTTATVSMHQKDEDGNWHRNSRGTVIYYEFEAGGNTYTGQGYGSWKRANREHQTICYDPDHPEDNLPLYDIDSKTKTHFIGLLLYLVVSFAIFFGLIWLFFCKIYTG